MSFLHLNNPYFSSIFPLFFIHFFSSSSLPHFSNILPFISSSIFSPIPFPFSLFPPLHSFLLFSIPCCSPSYQLPSFSYLFTYLLLPFLPYSHLFFPFHSSFLPLSSSTLPSLLFTNQSSFLLHFLLFYHFPSSIHFPSSSFLHPHPFPLPTSSFFSLFLHLCSFLIPPLPSFFFPSYHFFFCSPLLSSSLLPPSLHCPALLFSLFFPTLFFFPIPSSLSFPAIFPSSHLLLQLPPLLSCPLLSLPLPSFLPLPLLSSSVFFPCLCFYLIFVFPPFPTSFLFYPLAS